MVLAVWGHDLDADRQSGATQFGFAGGGDHRVGRLGRPPVSSERTVVNGTAPAG